MNEDIVDIWQIQPKTGIIDKITAALEDTPAEVQVSVTLTGFGAARFHFARAILMAAFDMTEEDATKYLTRAGAEREIERLAYLWAKARPEA